jgi:hypothetical protein
MPFILIVGALLLIDFAAIRYGADTREGRDWQPADDPYDVSR